MKTLIKVRAVTLKTGGILGAVATVGWILGWRVTFDMNKHCATCGLSDQSIDLWYRQIVVNSLEPEFLENIQKESRSAMLPLDNPTEQPYK